LAWNGTEEFLPETVQKWTLEFKKTELLESHFGADYGSRQERGKGGMYRLL
jgi:hypothetical protein